MPRPQAESRERREPRDQGSNSRKLDTHVKRQDRPVVQEKSKARTFMDNWVEPSLSAQPSFQDHGGAPYGVLEHMQPLGERPNTRVKTRVKSEAPRKSVQERSSAAAGLDAQEIPEGSPAPLAMSQTHVSTPPPPAAPVIVVDDEKDDDYAPRTNGKKKEHVTKSRTIKRQSESARVSTGSSGEARGYKRASKRAYNVDKIKAIVEDAKRRAIESGKPDLAAAVQEIYIKSLSIPRLSTLLKAIMMQDNTEAQLEEFQTHVRRAKSKIKEEKKARVRNLPAGETNGSQQALPLRSPTKLTRNPSELESPARQSTEHTDNTKPKFSIRVKSPSKSSGQRHHRHSTRNSASPSRKRSASMDAQSDISELTELASDNDMEMDERQGDDLAGPSSRANDTKGRDHAAERGSLAVQGSNIKRSSADAELLENERERIICSKKQKLSETVARGYDYSESEMRSSLTQPSSSQRGNKRGSNGGLVAPRVALHANGSCSASATGSRAASTDLDSPLSSPALSSRRSTPHVWKGPTKTTGKRAKTKTSPEKKQSAAYGGMHGAGGAGRESPIGDDDNGELSDNNDFCSACGGSGFLLCCDGCDRSFHFTCLDPPLYEDASELNEPWFCFICVAKRPISAEQPEKVARGLFAPLLNSINKRNPSTFALPQEIRNYFEGVATDRAGQFNEAVRTKTRSARTGYDDKPDDFRTKDSKSNTVLCFSCGKSSQGKRPIISCDCCGEHWHLDCLDPPLANAPGRGADGSKVHDWMCPLHVDHDLRKVDARLLDPRRLGRKVHIRKPKNAKVLGTALNRGHRNNGIVEVLENESDASDSEFYEEEREEAEGTKVYKLPAHGIKLDFLDKVKQTRVQKIRNDQAYNRAARLTCAAPSQLNQANFARRSFREKQTVFTLAQFASTNTDLNLGGDRVEILVGTLIAEAPPNVVEHIMADETADSVRRSTTSLVAIPPSPPVSEQTDQLSPDQRKELLALQELIRRRLEGGKT